ncbi:unnamed protein product [Cutaneotrichosporon oleaginosum]
MVLCYLSNSSGTRSHLSKDVLDLVLNYVPSSALTPLLLVNSVFYNATMPHLFRELHLTRDFTVRGPGYWLLDQWTEDGSRPLFLTEWVIRCTTVLHIPAHEPHDCWSLFFVHLPPLRLRTIHMAYDIHNCIGSGADPTPCAIHSLPVVNVVHYWTLLSRAPATSTNFANGTIKFYTVMISYGGFASGMPFIDPMWPSFAPDVTITCILPPVLHLPQAMQQHVRLFHNSLTADQASYVCTPLPDISRNLPSTMAAYKWLTSDCNHYHYCIHSNLLTCAKGMMDAHRRYPESQAKFVFMGLDEYIGWIIGDRESIKRAQSHLSFLTKGMAQHYLEHAAATLSDPATAQLCAKFGKIMSNDSDGLFRVMLYEEWIVTPSARLTLPRKLVEGLDQKRSKGRE